jgi:hypothetical protein
VLKLISESCATIPSSEEYHRGWNANIGRNESPPVEWPFKCSETLDEEQEETDENIEAIDPTAPECFERRGRLGDILFIKP